MNYRDKVYVAGHTGMVGSAIVRALKKQGFNNTITKTHKELDLTNQALVKAFFSKEKPDYVFIAAAKVGGIQENREHPADLLYINMMINANIIQSAYEFGVKKLLVLGSSCIYPRNARQPMCEDEFLSGKPEPTNEGYAIGKIVALELCKLYKKQYNAPFISCMPTNIYGENDNFDLHASHVIPAMIRKFYEAKINNQKEVVLWGTGSPLREFLYVDDLAEACLFLMDKYEDEEHINIGTGEEVSIRELANIIKDIVGYNGNIIYDTTKPDGNPRKLLDSKKIHELGWKHKISLKEGIEKSYNWFINSRK
ncbi:GDP-L-fucose synthase family protein [Megamonas funiformis]|jgi:GDP-L-fucose synthase|uniref:GDP-L-fucose synthase family protein n=1 Tax=Megamonas funiformis TaxID=437897 RepID=UPI0022E325FE|nr:GDP-L-fucose synthase [Megamonas funiformis]